MTGSIGLLTEGDHRAGSQSHYRNFLTMLRQSFALRSVSELKRLGILPEPALPGSAGRPNPQVGEVTPYEPWENLAIVYGGVDGVSKLVARRMCGFQRSVSFGS